VVSDEAATVTQQALTWHQRPSSLLQIENPLHAYLVDDALALRLRLEQAAAAEERSAHEGGLPPGQTYANESDFDNDDWTGPVEVAFPVGG